MTGNRYDTVTKPALEAVRVAFSTGATIDDKRRAVDAAAVASATRSEVVHAAGGSSVWNRFVRALRKHDTRILDMGQVEPELVPADAVVTSRGEENVYFALPDGRTGFTKPSESETWTPAPKHAQDAGCAGFIEDGECRVCGVTHVEPCVTCAATGYHAPGCPEGVSHG